jgi:glycosyltransferase involved in cell wall biosynthesis
VQSQPSEPIPMKKRILMISPIPTHPQNAGNRSRIYRLLCSLKDLGHEVHFLYVNTEVADEKGMQRCWGDNFYVAPYRFPARSLFMYMKRVKFVFERGFRHIQPVDFRYDKSLDEFLAVLSRRTRFDVVMVEYVFWSKALECFDGGVLKLIDTHDVFAKRHLMYLENKEEYYWYCTSVMEEAKGLNRADVIVAIQPQEREYLSTLTRKKTIMIGHIGPLEKPMQGCSTERTMLFVGSASVNNVHGLRYFMNEVLPSIRMAIPDSKLLVAGEVSNAIGEYEGCVKLGVVEDLKPIYQKAGLVINPIRFSTGLSIKTIEAMGYSKPVVATSMGSKGLETEANKAFLLADDPAEFAQSVVKVLTDEQLAARLSASAYEFVKRWNEASVKELASVLE